MSPFTNRCGRIRHRSAGAFSLVEVTLAIGVVAFAFVAVLGLLPTSMQTAENGYEQARATEILNTASLAVMGQRYLGENSGNRNYAFGDWLSDADDPQDNPTKYYVTQSQWEYADFSVLESGAIRPKNASRTRFPARHKLMIRVKPPADDTQPVSVYLSVAWPAAAEWDTTNRKWKNSHGFVETVINAIPPKSI